MIKTFDNAKLSITRNQCSILSNKSSGLLKINECTPVHSINQNKILDLEATAIERATPGTLFVQMSAIQNCFTAIEHLKCTIIPVFLL